MSREGELGAVRAQNGTWAIRRAIALVLAAANAGAALAQTQTSDLRLGEEIVVVGSRLRPQEAGEGHQAVVVFDSEDIARTGASNIADVLNYLPQATFSQNEQTLPGGARIIQLHGLTVGNTLVLINGRRAATSADLVAFDAFNVNSIPLTSVERIEVLSDSASAVYGTDATGGVVNIVLKSSIPTPELGLSYGKAAGGADERRLTAGVGHEGERYQFAISGDYFRRGFLLGNERPQTSDQDFRPEGGMDFRSLGAPLTNIVRPGGANLPGTNSPFASVPPGGNGQSPNQFAGTTLAPTSLQQYSSIVPASIRRSAVANGSVSFTDELTMFGELLYTDQNDERRFSPSAILGGLVPANNPTNPFGVPVSVSRLFVEAGPQTFITDSKLYRGVLGLRGSVGSWDWETYVLDSSDTTHSSTLGQIDIGRATLALRSTDPAVTPNLFRDAPIDPAIINGLRAPVFDDGTTSDNLQGSLYFRGPVVTLPGGEVSAVIGAEPRRERIHFEGFEANTVFSQSRTIYAEFAEVRAPLVSEAMSIPLVRRLTVTAAGRDDHYSDFGNTFNPEYGLEWLVVKGVNLRASYGRSFRAPSLFEVYQTPTVVTAPTFDPRRNETVNAALSIGGNTQLRPERSNTFAGGLDFTPEMNGSPRLSLTYWRIQQFDRLQRLNQATAIQNEATFPDRVIRNTPTPADIAAGLPGQLTALNLTNINAGNLDTNGFDVQLAGSWKTGLGTIAPSLAATQITRYRAADFPASPIVDRLAVASSQGSIPRLRSTLTIPWTIGGYGLIPSVRYISAYNDVNLLNVQNRERVSSQTLVDLQGTVDFQRAFGASSWSKGLTLRVGAVNLLNKQPPFADVSPLGYDPTQGDLRERFVYGAIQKAF